MPKAAAKNKLSFWLAGGLLTLGLFVGWGWPAATSAQLPPLPPVPPGPFNPFIMTLNDINSNKSGIERLVELELLKRRGNYAKSRDTYVGECQIGFDREQAMLYYTAFPNPLLPPTPDFPDPDLLLITQPGQRLTNSREILSVPTHEVGNLLNLSQEICIQLKAIRRVQYELEEKTVVEDIAARKETAKQIDQHAKEVFESLRKSHAISPGLVGTGQAEGEPNYVTNTGQYLEDVDRETVGGFVDNLTKVNNPFKNELAVRVGSAAAQRRLEERLGSSVSRAEVDAFAQDFNAGGWAMWLKVIEPQNNYAGASLLAERELADRRTRAEENSRAELVAGGGFLPTRECKRWSADRRWCEYWQVSTPASLLGGYAGALTATNLRQAEGVNAVGQEFVGSQFPAQTIQLANLHAYFDPIENIRDQVNIYAQFARAFPCLQALGLNLGLGQPANRGFGLNVPLDLSFVDALLNGPLGEIGQVINELLAFLQPINVNVNLQTTISGCLGPLLGNLIR